ncbi:MAG: glycosyltransferase [Armatimonadota bacterium]|nr:glycosyltransferase [Armatimonadota bacterium]
MNILVYTDEFLMRSMTFIYRPLLEIAGKANVSAACLQRFNEDLFPFENVYAVPNKCVSQRFARKVLRRSGLALAVNDTRFERYLHSHICEKGFDLAHAHFGPGALRIYPVLRRLDIPLLVSFHGYDVSSWFRYRGYTEAIISLMSRREVHGITVSNKMREALSNRGINVKRIAPLHPGIDTTFFDSRLVKTNRNPREFVFLQISNMVEKKGHEYTLAAFARAISSLPPDLDKKPALVIAGNGPLRGWLKTLAARLGLSEWVRFAGPVDREQARDMMTGADMFVHHSVTASSGDQEGLPSALMEAMAMGLPILSTRHSGIPELVRERVDGILVDEKDVSGYAEAMRLAFIGKMNWHDPAASRRRIIEEYDLVSQSKRLLDMYAKIIGGNRQAAA